MRKLHLKLSSIVIFSVLHLLQADLGMAQAKLEKDYLFPVEVTENSYQGAGLNWLLSEAKKSQYVLFGEQHGVQQLGEFIGYTLEELHEDGVNYFGLEMDAWTIQRLQENGVESFLSSYPNSVAFGYDGELQLIQKALDMDLELGGMDQMITAVHPLQRLTELSNTTSQKRLSQGAFLKASLKMGEYLREEHFQDLEALEAEFSSHASAEVHQILNELKMSMQIYTTWRAGQRGEVSRQKSPQMRERMMNEKFDAWLFNNGDQHPKKAVLKMGGAHLMYGIGPNGIPTLGEHIREQAAKKGFSTFSIGIRNFDPETAFIAAEDFGDADVLVIDTRILRDRIENGRIVIPHFQDNELSFYGFDAIVYFRNAEWSKQSKLSTFKQNFRSDFFAKIIPLAVLWMLCFTSLFPVAYQLFKRKAIEGRVPMWISITGTCLLTGLVVFQLLAIRSVIPHSATIMPANISLWVFLILLALSGIYLYQAAGNFTQKRFSSAFRIYYLTMAVCFTLLSVYCYYWNIGGMLLNTA